MRRRVATVIAVVIGIGVVAVVVVALARPVPPATLRPGRLPRVVPGRLTALVWPAVGEAAVGVKGAGMMASRGSDRPVPIASVAKVMTAFLVLRDHPLRPSQDGPLITVTRGDAAIYKSDLATGQSTAKVQAGERLTERQALEALMLPSANNVATLLAGWDSGSEAAFVARMNAEARRLGLAHTHYVDASGLQPQTVSTARDQVRLATSAFRIPTLVQIVAMPRVTLPVAGVVNNFDTVVGSDGILAGKTGSTSEAGGCFVFAARRVVGRRPVIVFGAVLGQPVPVLDLTSLGATFHAATALLHSISRVLEPLTSVDRDPVVARLTAPWTTSVGVRLRGVPPLVVWPGLRVRARIVASRHLQAPVRAGQRVGTAVFEAGGHQGRAYLVATRTLPSPSLTWRLTHP